MDAIIRSGARPAGRLRMPPDKAICQRAVLLALLAEGTTRISPWPASEDCQRALAVAAALGAAVTRAGEAVEISGCGPGLLRAPAGPLACGESGTTLRLAAGLLAGQPLTVELAAGPQLSRRPMRRVVEPLTRMGAQITGSSAAGAECYPPLRITGRRPLEAIRYAMPVASAQVKSAVLLAGLAADGPTTVEESRPTRDHTERMLAQFGARVRREGAAVTVTPGPLVSPGMVHLPGDISSAAFFLVGAACVPEADLEVEGVGLNPTRLGLLGVLARMGARVEVHPAGAAGEPAGRIRVRGGALAGIALGPEEVPGVIDELPILMVAAALARGRSRFRGVGELRVKETDRLQSMVEGLRTLGAQVTTPDQETVEVVGGTLLGTTVDGAGDHRTVMSLAIAGLAARGETRVRGAECVRKSLPEFFELLAQVTDSSTVKTVDNPAGLC